MVTKLYAIRDVKVNEFNSPYSLANDVIAKRALQMSVNDPKRSMLTQFPNDYDLFWIGDYDSVSAKIVSVIPVFVCNAGSLCFGPVSDSVEEKSE